VVRTSVDVVVAAAVDAIAATVTLTVTTRFAAAALWLLHWAVADALAEAQVRHGQWSTLLTEC
jgi:hypothetical protein